MRARCTCTTARANTTRRRSTSAIERLHTDHTRSLYITSPTDGWRVRSGENKKKTQISLSLFVPCSFFFLLPFRILYSVITQEILLLMSFRSSRIGVSDTLAECVILKCLICCSIRATATAAIVSNWSERVKKEFEKNMEKVTADEQHTHTNISASDDSLTTGFNIKYKLIIHYAFRFSLVLSRSSASGSSMSSVEMTMKRKMRPLVIDGRRWWWVMRMLDYLNTLSNGPIIMIKYKIY